MVVSYEVYATCNLQQFVCYDALSSYWLDLLFFDPVKERCSPFSVRAFGHLVPV